MRSHTPFSTDPSTEAGRPGSAVTRRLALLAIARQLMRPLLFLAVLASATLLLGVDLARAAVDAVPAPVDGIATGATAANAGWDLVQTYGPLWGGLAVVLAVGQRWLAKNDAQHWLAQGRLLTAITGAVGVLGSIAQWKWSGAPSSGIVVTAFGAISLLWHPQVTLGGVPVSLLPQPTPATAPTPATTTNPATLAIQTQVTPMTNPTIQSAPTAPTPTTPTTTAATAAKSTLLTALLAVLIGGVVLQPACATAIRDLKAVGQTIWDCTAPERSELVTLLTPVFASLLTRYASADGKSIDTSALGSATSKQNLESDASVALECAKAKAFSDALTPPPATPGAPAAAGLVLDPTALRAAYERIRPAKSAFLLPGGKVL
jgi:hypothetical protein